MNNEPKKNISFVIPLFNEQENLTLLHEKLTSEVQKLNRSYEIIFIDDGSTDKSLDVLTNLHKENGRIRIFSFRGNLGKSEALNCGFSNATGKIIITLDADMQDDPAEIHKFIEKIESGFDLVVGWRKPRRDSLTKKISSRLFNFIVKLLSGLKLHDINCGFKAMTHVVAKELNIYGELHRLIPALAYWKKFRVTEIIVNHQPRHAGTSNFGLERTLKGIFDLLTVTFLGRYRRRPLHFFGSAGFTIGLIGFIISGYLAIEWFQGVRPIGNRPLLMLGVLMIIMGVQLFSVGLLGEMIASRETTKEKEFPLKKTQG